jgi:DNA polymerase
MNERQQRAWAALDLGPVWIARAHAVCMPAGEPQADLLPQGQPTPSSTPVLTLHDLRDQVMGCEKCALAAGRTQVVFGRGPSPAPWMVIGEAPGEQEDLQGVPFVGPAGQLLDQMLAAIGVERARDVFVANVLKCRPPRNRDPLPEEVAQCRPWLVAQIAAVQPRVILAVGRFAAQTVLQTDETIGRLRGTVHRSGEIPVVATYHPSYLLRSPAEKAKAWQDLLMARSLVP